MTHQPLHTMPTTIFTDIMRVGMDFAVAINAAALLPLMLNRTQ